MVSEPSFRRRAGHCRLRWVRSESFLRRHTWSQYCKALAFGNASRHWLCILGPIFRVGIALQQWDDGEQKASFLHLVARLDVLELDDHRGLHSDSRRVS